MVLLFPWCFLLELIERISKSLQDVDGVEFAILFGSHARGTNHKFSDIDIGVYLSKKVSLRQLLRYLPILKKPIDLKILNDTPPLFRLKVLREGKILFVKDENILKNFIYNTLVEALEYRETYEKILRIFSRRVLYGP